MAVYRAPLQRDPWREDLQEQISRVISVSNEHIDRLIENGSSTAVVSDAQNANRQLIAKIVNEYNDPRNITYRQTIVDSNPSIAWSTDAARQVSVDNHGRVVSASSVRASEDTLIREVTDQNTGIVNLNASNNSTSITSRNNRILTPVSSAGNGVSTNPEPATLPKSGVPSTNETNNTVSNTNTTTGTQTSPNVYKPPGITDYQSGRRPKAFGWLEEYIDPTMFASSDACLITIGASRKSLNEDGSIGKVLGLCNNVSFALSNNIVTLKELRAERTIIIPGKSAPGSITLARLLCKGDNVTNFLSIISGSTDKKLKYDNQLRSSKNTFGIGIVMFSSIGQKEIASFYIEQCILNSISVPVPANQYTLYENIGITFNRILDL